jgi:hypothetical protein
MPFTFSHPALIIPLLRTHQRFRWVSATGLIAGSIAPDFEKFIRLKLANGHSHTIASIFYFSCPVALVLAVVFHLVVRRPLLAHLPGPLHRRLARFAGFDWLSHFRRHYLGVLFSIILGAALHLLWDGFTHKNALVIRVLPVLARPIGFGNVTLMLFEVLGMLSSVLGGVAIGWAVWQMPAGQSGAVPAVAAMQRYWGLAALVAGALVVQWVLVVQPGLLDTAITTISAGLVGVVVASVVVQRMGGKAIGGAEA